MAERIPGLQFEMQRRVILFRSTTTMPDGSTLGYNSDPNNAVNNNTPGETLLYNCPRGTRYQEDDGTQWIKQGSPNTWKTIAFQGEVETHDRLHSIDSPTDHAPDIENKGKIIILEETEGKPTFIDVEGEDVEGVGKPIIVEKDYENKKITIKLDESKVDHNKLLNYEEDRHREMNYSDVLKSYLIKP